jgi:nitrate reductase cytochrome c-type subunit
MAALLITLTSQPPAIAGAIDSYSVEGDTQNCVDSFSRSPLRFDLNHHKLEQFSFFTST